MEMSTLFESFFHQKAGAVRKQREAIEKILTVGPSTVSAIADATGYEKNLVLWNLMGMLRWGVIEVEGEGEHELSYVLKEV
jgi:predicted transcriptional regulator